MAISAESPAISAKDLKTFTESVFRQGGLSPSDARICSDAIVQTDLWGVDSHGVLRLLRYADRLENGAVNRDPHIKKLGGKGSFAVQDGDAGMGYVVGHHATKDAIILAENHGIGAVAVRNSNHFGAAGLYVNQMVEAGMIGIAMTNVIPNLVMPGMKKPITGNNPIAFGVSSGLGFPLILDISMSAVAGGKLLLARERGEEIPLGWATDKEGRPTHDPAAGFEGFLLPLGGHKGFGLSLMVDVLCGVLSGGVFQHAIRSMYEAPEKRSGTCHLFISLDPDAFIGRQALESRMRQMCETIHDAPVRDGEARAKFPGEIEHETLLRRERDGIPLPAGVLADLRELADRHALEMPPLIYN